MPTVAVIVRHPPDSRLTSRRRSLPEEVRGSDPGRMKTTSAGTTATFGGDELDQRGAGGRFVGALELRGDHQSGTRGRPVGADGDDGTGPDSFDLRGHRLDLGREDVAPGDGDDLLGTPTDHQAAVQEVADIPGGEPVFPINSFLAEITAHHRGAADLHLADVAVGDIAGELLVRRDADLHPRDGPAQHGVLADVATGIGDDVDLVDLESVAGAGNGYRAVGFGQTVGGGQRAGVEAELGHLGGEAQAAVAVDGFTTVERETQIREVGLADQAGVLADDVVGHVRCGGHRRAALGEPFDPPNGDAENADVGACQRSAPASAMVSTKDRPISW